MVQRGIIIATISKHLTRAGAWIVFWGAWYLIYAVLNARGADGGVYWDLPGFFQAWAVYPYVFGSLILMVLPLPLNWRGMRTWSMLTGFTVAATISFIIYWLYPVVMERVDYAGPGLARALMRKVVGLDDPANCFPSSHCMFAVLGFWYVLRGSGVGIVSILSGILAGLVCLSTVLVGQHYWLDIPAGILSAVGGIVIAHFVFRSRSSG